MEAIMGKSVVDNNTVIPRKIKTLFGKPAVVRTETKTYNELQHFPLNLNRGEWGDSLSL